jgi:hypothetical protein
VPGLGAVPLPLSVLAMMRLLEALSGIAGVSSAVRERNCC